MEKDKDLKREKERKSKRKSKENLMRTTEALKRYENAGNQR